MVKKRVPVDLQDPSENNWKEDETAEKAEKCAAKCPFVGDGY